MNRRSLFIGIIGGILALLGACTTTNTPSGISTTSSPLPSFSPPSSPEFSLPPPVAPRPVVVKGQGAEVKKIELEADSPLVANGSHNGSSNFQVELVPSGGGDEVFVFNEIGDFEGEAAFDEITSGPYRLKVTADGSWKIRLEQPVPEGDEADLEDSFRGSGAEVLRVQVFTEIQPTVEGHHSGESNFQVQLIGYGDLSGSVFVFNEIGDFDGETVTDEALPSGTYLLYVQADGKWSLRFSV